MTEDTQDQNNNSEEELIKERLIFNNVRACPQCELTTLYGARGSATSICKNCGFKDPCCGD